MSQKLPRAISFSGCGFIGVYHIGLIRCFQKYGEGLLSNIVSYGGASAGSLAAAVLAICPEKVPQCRVIVKNLVSAARASPFGPFSSSFNLTNQVRSLAETVLPDDAHKKATGRLYLSITHKKCGKNVIVSEYASRDELIQCLVCSCHIPIYSGMTYPSYKNELYYDGGFTNNLVNFESEDTIYVTPFSGGAKYVCPRDTITRWNFNYVNQDVCLNLKNARRLKDALIPPSDSVLDQYYRQGFMEGMAYLVDLDEKSDEFCMKIPSGVSYQSLTVSVDAFREEVKNRKKRLKKTK